MRRVEMEIVEAMARKLLWARAMESAAVVAVAGGLGAAALETAWIVAARTVAVAAVIAAVPVMGGTALLAVPAVRRALHLEKVTHISAAGVCLLAGAWGIASVWAGWYADVGTWLLPVVLLPVGALVGGVGRAAVGVTLHQAAVFLDVHGALGERLSTAAELADSPDRDAPFAGYVYAQALAVARSQRLENLRPWKRSRATAGAVGLVALLCGALALVPAHRPELHLQIIAASLGRMELVQRDRLASDLRRAARRAAANSQLACELARAAVAAENRDQAQLKESLADVQRALESAPDRLAAAVEKVLLALQREAEGVGGVGPDGQASGGEPTSQEAAVGDGQRQGGMVGVFDPLYKQALGQGRADDRVGRVALPDSGSAAMVAYEDAWQAARDRAAAALVHGTVPARHRELVRDFFLAE